MKDATRLAGLLHDGAARQPNGVAWQILNANDAKGQPLFSAELRQTLEAAATGVSLTNDQTSAFLGAMDKAFARPDLIPDELLGTPQYPEETMKWLKKRAEAGEPLDAASAKSLNRSLLAAQYPELVELGPGGLGFTAGMIGLILGLAGSIGAVAAPFIAGQVADRYFSAERFLAILLLIGGGVKWFTAYQTSYTAWLWLSVLYSVLYMPTLALSNSIAFAHMSNQEKQFPKVRVWGTIGWIAASWIFPMLWLQTGGRFQVMPPFFVGTEVPFVTHHLVDALKFAGVVSFIYAGYCLLLPHTPPKKDAAESLAFAKAFRLLRHKSFMLIFLVSLPISVIHQIYFMQTSPFLSAIGLRDTDIMPAMSIGQFAEIGVMAVLGLMLTRLGFRWVIFIGTIAYAARYAVFGTLGLPNGLVVSSQVLHGFCYACFFAASYIYVDRLAPPDIRHSAQTLYGIFILGLGPVLGGYLSGQLDTWFGDAGSPAKFAGIWYTQAAIALVTGLIFLLLFRSEVKPQGESMPISKAGEDELAEQKL